ncbi:DoxX family protein [Actinomadura barringtoniae]|uniref:DoxX family protein n=1 Tax=Actinomadura barringtoniae TaxID=1427535 RepID=A0A939PMU8_9ACTN|nr:DoxX family protein [Actinomadura barringtoniae]MBO2455180.1 DoxX family protein [Actinomadura barringtoniae]
MNVALWVGQALLAVVFAYSGALKVSQSKEKLVKMGQTGVAVFPVPLLRFVASCELLGAVGVTVPWLTDTAPVLTPLAAAGFMAIMVGAIAAHARLHEPRNVAATSLVLVVAAVVAAGRFGGM